MRRVELRQRPADLPMASREQRMSVPNSMSLDSLPPMRPSNMRPASVAIMGSISESTADSLDLSRQKPRLFDMRLLADSLESPASRHSDASSLEDAVHSLSSALEDFRGQYPELHTLEEHIHSLDALIKVSLLKT